MSATNDEISRVGEEISLQQQAYNRYIQQANSVGLSAALASQVKNGTININEYDKDTAKKINDYKQWYENALNAQEAMLDLTEKVAELYKSKFDMAKTDFENEITLLEHVVTTYDKEMDDIVERGYLATTKLYEAQADIRKGELEVLNSELDELIARMSDAVNSGTVEEGSEAWYEMQQNINSVKEEIQDTELEVVKLVNAVRQTRWDRFDYLLSRIEEINEEAQFLVDLLSDGKLFDKNGKATEAGIASMGLHAQMYATYMDESKRIAEELVKINAEIADDPNNTKLLEHRQELLKAQRENIKAANDQKEAIKSLVKEGIDAELASLKELIDAYNNNLDRAKNLYDYQKKVKTQASDIAKLQKQIAAYSNDSSGEAKARVQKIQVDLNDAIEKLEETQYDHYISEQKQILDDFYNEYSTLLNDRIDNSDALLAEVIAEVNSQAGSIINTLNESADKVGYTISTETRDIWANEGLAYAIISEQGANIVGGITSLQTVLNGIAVNVASMVKASDKKAEEKKATTTPSTAATAPPKPSTPTNTSAATTNKTKFDEDVKRGVAAAIWIYGGPGSGWGNDPERRNKLKAKFGDANAAAIQSYINSHGPNGDLYRYWASTGRSNLKKYYYSAFKTGGLADYTGPAWVDGSPSKPEIVLNPRDTQNFIDLKDAMRSVANGTSPLSGLFGGNIGDDIIDKLSDIAAPSEGLHSGIGDVTYNITIPIDHVEDADDFLNQMRKDRKFIDWIQSVTINRLAGGSVLEKNKYRW